MTVTTSTHTAIAPPLAHAADGMQMDASDAKWPIPYAAMFMVGASAALWYGIYSAGSAIVGIFG